MPLSRCGGTTCLCGIHVEPRHHYVEQCTLRDGTGKRIVQAAASGGDLLCPDCPAVQVATFDYLQQVATNVGEGTGGVEAPSFAALIQDLKRGTFHMSTNWMEIPEAYLDPVVVQISAVRYETSAPSVDTTTVTQATSRLGVPSLTQEASRAPVARVQNPNNDAELAGIIICPGGTRLLLRQHPPPSNEAGHEFCVAWWTRGVCFDNCSRRATHTNFASASERTRLLAYVREHLQAPVA